MAADPVEVALNAQTAHVFADTATCVCGFKPETGPDWDRHRMAVALDAVADWLAEHASDVLADDPYIRAADWAAKIIQPVRDW